MVHDGWFWQVNGEECSIILAISQPCSMCQSSVDKHVVSWLLDFSLLKRHHWDPQALGQFPQNHWKFVAGEVQATIVVSTQTIVYPPYYSEMCSTNMCKPTDCLLMMWASSNRINQVLDMGWASASMSPWLTSISHQQLLTVDDN